MTEVPATEVPATEDNGTVTSEPVSSWSWRARILVAPLVLCCVAAWHFLRVSQFEQTPWKGGGFGMFSTVDSVAARYLRIYMVSSKSTVPVDVPPWLEQQATSVRTAPSQRKLDQLAAALAAQHWTHQNDRWRRIRQQYRNRTTEGAVDAGLLQSERVADRPSITDEPARLVAMRSAPIHLREPAALTETSVRVELWRYQFDSEKTEITAARSLVAEHPCRGSDK